MFSLSLLIAIVAVSAMPFSASCDSIDSEAKNDESGFEKGLDLCSVEELANRKIIGLVSITKFKDASLARAADDIKSNIKNFRVSMIWREAEPKRGEFNWSVFDQEINSILGAGAESILLTLGDLTPAWAQDRERYGSNAWNAPPKDIQDWYNFCQKVAERYGHVVDYYEIWNEPGWDVDSVAEGDHFGGRLQIDYIKLLHAGYDAIKSVDPESAVISGSATQISHGLPGPNPTDPYPDDVADPYRNFFDPVKRYGLDLSMKVESSGEVVCERPMYFDYSGKWKGGHNVVGANEASNKWYFAEGCTRNNFEQWICMQNPNDEKANVTITYMMENSETKTTSHSIPARSRYTVSVNSGNEVGSDKDVSAMIEADSPIICERPMYFNYMGAWQGGHNTMGATEPLRDWYFAEGYTGEGFDMWLCLQNPDETKTATVTVEFMFEDRQNETKKLEIPPTSRETWKINDLIGQGHNVSMSVSGDIPIVAERPMYFFYKYKWFGGHIVAGVPEASKEWYFAEGCTRSGFEQWLCMQNPNDEKATVEVRYMFETGEVLPMTYELPPKSRVTKYVNEEIGFQERDVSTAVMSDIEIICERPVYFDYKGIISGGHNVSGATSLNNTWYFAEGCCGFNIEEWLCIQNPQNFPVNVTITYMTDYGYNIVREATIEPTSRYTINVNDAVAPASFCDIVGVHPYENPWNWGPFYKAVRNGLAGIGIYKPMAISEIGWPNRKIDVGAMNPGWQAEAIGDQGLGGLWAAGATMIWVYCDMDPDDIEKVFDKSSYGLLKTDGTPHEAWSQFFRWQSQNPRYPELPRNL